MNKQVAAGLIFAVVVAFVVGTLTPMGAGWSEHNVSDQMMMMETMDEHRDDFLAYRAAMIMEMIEHGEYRCCLESPCTYCIEKTPGHGEGATCDCLADIVEGKHPCGECIGEILEGHGNQYLAEYFAVAIAEEVGEQHVDTLRAIISEKYDIAIEKQR